MPKPESFITIRLKKYRLEKKVAKNGIDEFTQLPINSKDIFEILQETEASNENRTVFYNQDIFDILAYFVAPIPDYSYHDYANPRFRDMWKKNITEDLSIPCKDILLLLDGIRPLQENYLKDIIDARKKYEQNNADCKIWRRILCLPTFGLSLCIFPLDYEYKYSSDLQTTSYQAEMSAISGAIEVVKVFQSVNAM